MSNGIDLMSLGAFERQYGVNKGTVSKAAREAGFDTSNGLTPDAVNAMKQHFKVSAIVKAEPKEQPVTPATKAIEVYDGNPAKSLPVPAVPTEVNLAQFRRSGTSIIDLSTVVSTISFTKQLGQAMDADKERMYQELEALDAAEEQLDDAVTELDRAALIYEAETNILSRLQASKAKRVQDKLEKVQALGKPQTAPPNSTPQTADAS